MNKIVVVFILLLGLTSASPVQAQMVEVAPGVSVSRKVYPVPANEAPFFNFAVKSDRMKAADDEFVSNMLKVMPDRAAAARRAINAGWSALIGPGDTTTAVKRFNQAYLLDPRESGIYQGFAAVVADRFKDYDFADELFRVAARMNAPSTALSADHGRVMLMAGRPHDAKPLLEKAIRDDPDWAGPRSNLAWATFLMGQVEEACRLVKEVRGRNMDSVTGDLELLKQKAHC
ncbi:tetratricopeptide repeat protein [Microvirga terricola]|uniref:Tetratricopeptide repeat protein n=1 Tax=Microvirga terricola TaxID=2719797 RepID=A0ABX0VDS2_9HYPH|nr:tetratricopeptide repeat protein [Microvirga terricola]NIX77812.1 tetratricopeptide repeat protein [Microvirga terricola]